MSSNPINHYMPNLIIDPSAKPVQYTDYASIKAACAEALKDAAAKGETEVRLDSIEMKEKPSDNFVFVHAQLQEIVEFMQEESSVKEVSIVCPTEDNARMYKVVYNFYYPVDKSSRMKDSHWD